MATKLKFPYTMYCPKCKSGLKIKSQNLVGTQINCPNCKKRIYVVTPEEDANINYGVEAAPEKEKAPEPTEEELLERELVVKKKKNAEMLKQAWFWTTVVFLVALLGGASYGVFQYAIIPFVNEDFSVPKEGESKLAKEFQ